MEINWRNEMTAEEELRALQYFWKKKGDIERMSDWEAVVSRHPEVEAAWLQYKLAEKSFTLLLRGAIEEATCDV
jgi:hypothetical protein